MKLYGADGRNNVGYVTTCVVVWIEMQAQARAQKTLGHHLRGGVD